MEAIGQLSDARQAKRPARLRLDPKWLVLGAIVAAVVWLALVPLVFLLWQSFMTPQSASTAAVFTTGNYHAAYASHETVGLFVNSVEYASGAAVLGLVLGTGLAWVNERTNTPLKSFIYALSIVPLVIPSILFVVAWIMLASPKIGLVNLLLQHSFDTSHVFVNIYSIAGMIWVDGLHYAPIAFLMMSAAFRSMDPSLEESAMMSGASILEISRRITLKLAWPAVAASFLILFVRAIESFESPALLGLPVGIEVFTSSIYDALQRYPSDIGLASAYAVALLAVTSGGIYWQSRLGRQSQRYATVTGKGFRPRVLDLRRWRYLSAGFFLVYALLALVLPFLVLLWSSLQRFYTVPTWASLRHLTLNSYRTVLGYQNVGEAVWNSLFLAFTTATLVMLVSAIICWIVLRTRIPGRWLLDNVASMPLVIPGLVLGLAVMICYLTLGGGVYGTIWILLIAYVTRFMPYGMRYNTTSMIQVHKELEESAATAGASWLMSFWRIVLPLLKPGLLAGWIYIVVVSIRELSSSILLYSPGTEVVSVVIWEFWQNGQYVELSAFGVMLMAALFVFVMAAQALGKRFGIREA